MSLKKINFNAFPDPACDIELHKALGIKDNCEILSSEKTQKIANYFLNKRVLVTGGGGSIGRQLCKCLCHYTPESVTIFDINENNSYLLYCELKKQFPSVKVQLFIGNICDELRVKEVFETTKPQVVFHTAAHKHVPLMQNSPKQAVKNNVFATQLLMQISNEFCVEKFVLISSDKAVHPVSVMGMTKRVCEMLIQINQKNSNVKYSAVRFGNVFASDGSVVPLFLNQITKGGTLQLTSPDMNRYFISVKSACELLLLTASISNQGEIFMLDMGSPINLLTLANALIKRYSEQPIKIEYVGLREGERLNEELFYQNEIKTYGKKDYYVYSPSQFDFEKFEKLLKKLKNQIKKTDEKSNEKIVKLLSQIISLAE